MKRNTLLNLLHAYIPTAQESTFKERMIEFIHNEPDCFERSLAIGHITASCWLLDKTHSYALLTHHAKLKQWVQLGGHCDGESDVMAVALKEAREESGIIGIEPLDESIFDIDIHLIPENHKEKAHFHYDIRFLLHVVSNEQIMISSESLALQWFGKNRADLPTNNTAVVRLFNKWITR